MASMHVDHCTLLLAHIKTTLCGGNEVDYERLLALLADWSRHPNRPLGVGVVIGGPPGIGKTIFTDVLTKIWGRRNVLGCGGLAKKGRNGKGAMRDILRTIFSETSFGERLIDKDTLKSLVHSTTLLCEPMFKNPRQIPNTIGVFVTNQDTSAFDPRRFLVLNSAAIRPDEAYFAALIDEINSGGVEAFKRHLLAYGV